jgi:hypothetical protein
MRFIFGAIIGFILGTTMPNETRHYTKIFLEKVGNVIHNVTKKLDENSNSRNSNYDEDYYPTPTSHRNSRSNF